MKGLLWAGLLGALGTLLAGGEAVAGTIVEYTDASSFSTAMGVPLSVEDFGDSAHYPITTGTLNSATNLTVAHGTPIVPGMILPGVTYSTPIGTGNFFNITEGLYFSGAYLERSDQGGSASTALTTTFDGPVKGFGFDTSPLMGSKFTITIHFSSGADSASSDIAIPAIAGISFFGFVSSATDIVSADLYSSDPGSSRAFAIDNFTYAAPAAVPEPSTIVSAGMALLVGAACAWRRRAGRS